MNKPLTKHEHTAIIRQNFETARVYIISAGNFFKIGVSGNVSFRLRELRVGNPHALCLIYETDRLPREKAFRIEGDVHRLFSDYRLVGEWFRGLDSSDIISGVKECVSRRTSMESKHPWSGPELICAVCGEDCFPRDLDDNFTCPTCRGEQFDRPIMDSAGW